MKNNIFVTYGDGSKGWRDAKKRITYEANLSGEFDYVFGLDDKWLKSWNNDIYRAIRQIQGLHGRRGHGYWVWKSSVLVWADLLFPNHQIVYVDAGSRFNFSSHSMEAELGEWLKNATRRGGLAWQIRAFKEKYWTKRELVDFLKPSPEILNSGQVQSGFIVLPPSKERRDFLQHWRDISQSSNLFFLTDEIREAQIPGFVEHRHDQSIFSLLWKMYELPYFENLTDPKASPYSPILASRNNTGLPLGAAKWKIDFVSRRNRLIDLCKIN